MDARWVAAVAQPPALGQDDDERAKKPDIGGGARDVRQGQDRAVACAIDSQDGVVAFNGS